MRGLLRVSNNFECLFICRQVGDDADIDVATVHKYFMENFGADVKLKDVFDEDSQYDIGMIFFISS